MEGSGRGALIGTVGRAGWLHAGGAGLSMREASVHRCKAAIPNGSLTRLLFPLPKYAVDRPWWPASAGAAHLQRAGTSGFLQSLALLPGADAVALLPVPPACGVLLVLPAEAVCVTWPDWLEPRRPSLRLRMLRQVLNSSENFW